MEDLCPFDLRRQRQFRGVAYNGIDGARDAVFPTIAKGGFFFGAARGKGRVYEQGRYVGDTTMTHASLGFQLGGQAYSVQVRASLE